MEIGVVTVVGIEVSIGVLYKVLSGVPPVVVICVVIGVFIAVNIEVFAGISLVL